MKDDDREIFVADLVRMLRRSRTTIWRYVKTGYLPEPHESGPGHMAWYESEIIEWRKSRGETPTKPRKQPRRGGVSDVTSIG